MSLSEVFEQIEKDFIFYRNSGGGITVSGGEPFLQQKFLLSLLKACQVKLFHTAIETSGYFNWQKITDTILNYTELVLFDLKLMDKAKHKKYTGKENGVIQKNLKKMAGRVKTIVRIPVIPKINDDDRDLNEKVKFIRSLKKIEEINLVPYHNFGEFKYEMLQRKYQLKSCPEPSIERLQEIRNFYESNGIKTKIITI
jgi:pyruvate formate lyase activating enzyme